MPPFLSQNALNLAGSRQSACALSVQLARRAKHNQHGVPSGFLRGRVHLEIQGR